MSVMEDLKGMEKEEEETLEEQGWKQLFDCIWIKPTGEIVNIYTGVEYATEDEAMDDLLEDQEELIKKYSK